MTRPRDPAPRGTQSTEPDRGFVADAAPRAMDSAALPGHSTPIASDRTYAALRVLVRLLARQAAAEHAAAARLVPNPAHDLEAKPDVG